MTGTPVRRVEVTRPDGSRFISHSTLLAARCVFTQHDGYRLREVLGVDLREGFAIHSYLTDIPEEGR